MQAALSSGPVAGYDLARTGGMLSRGPNKRKKLTAAAWSNTWPAPGATLDLDFANNRGYVRGLGQGGAMDAITFTRASSGTYVGSDGLLKGGGNALGVNLLASPQEFDNAAWVKTAATVTANVIAAPDSTLTADKLVETTAGGVHQLESQSFTVAASSRYTASIRLKKGERSWAQLVLGPSTYFGSGGVAAYYDLNSVAVGTVTTDATALPSAAITDLGDGWCLCTFSATTNAASGGAAFYIRAATASNTVSYTGDGTSGIYIWGAQLEVGSSATTYYPTNVNAYRLDWASTATVAGNLITYTQDLNNAAWLGSNILAFGSGSVADTAATLDPFGANTAELVVPNTTNSAGHTIEWRVQTTISANTYTTSIYAKAGGYNYIFLQSASGRYGRMFNLNTGALASSTFGTLLASTITSVGGGWYRCTVTGDLPAQNDYQGCRVSIYASDSLASYAGDGVSGVYLCGGQFEVGSSATTYKQVGGAIPTQTPLAASATCNGLLIEESRANRILWCRDATGTPNRNLLTYSEQLNNAAWQRISVSVAADTITSPISDSTADRVTLSAGSATHYFQNQTAAATPASVDLTASVYLQAGTHNYVSVIIGGPSNTQWFGATVDLSAGTITKTGAGAAGSYLSSSITSVGSGWYRVTVTGRQAGAGSQLQVIANSTGTPTYGAWGLETWTAAGTETFGAWGTQIELASSASTYEQTTTSGAIWSKQNVTVAKDQTGIDGVSNAATSVTATANNGVLIQPILLASGSRTGSVYLKRITGTGNVQVSLDGTTWSTVDLSNGLWNRIVISGTVTNPTVGIKLATNGDAVAMDYAQVEDGAFATSPILTTTASATRSADIATMTTTDQWYSPVGQTVAAALKFTNYVSGSGIYGSIVSFWSTGRRIIISRGGFETRPYWFQIYDSVILSQGKGADYNDSSNGMVHKVALSYNNINAQFSVDGLSGVLSSSAYVMPPSVGGLMQIGNRMDTTSLLNGWLSRLTIIPKRFDAVVLNNLTGAAS